MLSCRPVSIVLFFHLVVVCIVLCIPWILINQCVRLIICLCAYSVLLVCLLFELCAVCFNRLFVGSVCFLIAVVVHLVCKVVFRCLCIPDVPNVADVLCSTLHDGYESHGFSNISDFHIVDCLICCIASSFLIRFLSFFMFL